MATCGQSSPPTPSVWASTSRTYDWSSTPTSPARWRTTCRKRGARAGTSRAARCVLLYTLEDVERQFGMSARSRLTRQEIHGVLKALRNLDRRKRLDGEVVATPGEILGEDDDREFERDSATDDTRVRSAVAWLEDAVLLTREENRVQVFPSSLRVASHGGSSEPSFKEPPCPTPTVVNC